MQKQFYNNLLQFILAFQQEMFMKHYTPPTPSSMQIEKSHMYIQVLISEDKIFSWN